MRPYTSLLTLLLTLIFLGGLPLTSDARNGPRDDEERQRRTKAVPDQKQQLAPRRRSDRPVRQLQPPAQRVAPRLKPKPGARKVHDRYYYRYRHYNPRDYRYYTTYYYHTYYLAPIFPVFHPIGFSLTILPVGYVRIIVGGLPYYYYDGMYYRYISNAYVVVRPPIGAVVHVLPVGFVAFTLGAFTYYYINETYYVWDEDEEAYVVVEKPPGADNAIKKETEGRLYIYPKKGQSKELQAKDRYACHRWAVKETGVDPIEADEPPTHKQDKNYKRAITACLEGRSYTVK
jgi:hypothetical protein